MALQKLKENSGRLKLPESTKSQLIDSGTANLILQLNDKLTDPNIRPKFEADIMTWAGFLRIADFIWGKSTFKKSSLSDIRAILTKLNAGQDYSGMFGEGFATNETGVHDIRMDTYTFDPENYAWEIENDGNIYRQELQPIWRKLSKDKLDERYSFKNAYNLFYPIAKRECEKWYLSMVEWADDGKSVIKKPSEEDIDKTTQLLVASFETDFANQEYDYMKGSNPLEGMSVQSIKKVLQRLIISSRLYLVAKSGDVEVYFDDIEQVYKIYRGDKFFMDKYKFADVQNYLGRQYTDGHGNVLDNIMV